MSIGFKNPLISIIVPVYNVEEYLSDCLNSIIRQTYTNIEIILIDDGSTDHSNDICLFFQNLDSRVVVQHQSNKGVAKARNLGIDLARGEYIVFIDADDTVERNFIEVLAEPLQINSFDVTICSWNDIYIYQNKIVKKSNNMKNDILQNDLSDDFYKLGNRLRYPCLKCYKKSIIDKYSIRFPEDFTDSEDQVFNFLFFDNVLTYIFIDKSLYNYFHREKYSLSKNTSKKSFECNLKKLCIEKEFFERNNITLGKGILNSSGIFLLRKYVVIDDIDDSYFLYKKRAKIIKRKLYSYRYCLNNKQKLALFMLEHNIYFFVYCWMILLKWLRK